LRSIERIQARRAQPSTSIILIRAIALPLIFCSHSIASSTLTS
jgi:hypothetical protein